MLVWVVAAACACASASRADQFATSPARPGYEGSGHLLWWDGRRDAEAAGLVVDGTYALDMFVAPQLDDAATAGGLLTLDLDLDLDLAHLARRGLGRMHMSSFAIHGESPSNELVDLHGVSGDAAPPDVLRDRRSPAGRTDRRVLARRVQPPWAGARVPRRRRSHRSGAASSRGLLLCRARYADGEHGAETIVETSYEAQLDWLTIQPDLQLMLMREQTVAIGIVRTTVAF